MKGVTVPESAKREPRRNVLKSTLQYAHASSYANIDRKHAGRSRHANAGERVAFDGHRRTPDPRDAQATEAQRRGHTSHKHTHTYSPRLRRCGSSDITHLMREPTVRRHTVQDAGEWRSRREGGFVAKRLVKGS